ncbi:MAG TPA: response regulator [Thermoanaerobaculia bacterium]|nr:response regulator [Thermoanaerobaculia bacterium]
MPKRILLADDSITIQKVVELTFSDGDYEVVAVNNGAKAIQKLSEMRPDIILSDIIMPEKNGYEVCEYVKSHPDFRTIPVVLLTGTFEPFDPERADKAGCDAVVTKPFESQSLIQKVEELIQQNAPAAGASSAPAGADTFASEPMAQPFGGQTSPFAETPPTGYETPFEQAPAEAFSGETRAFPRMSFEEMQRMASDPAAPHPAPPPAAAPEKSPWEEPPQFSGETRAFPAMSFEEMQRMAQEPAASSEAPPTPPASPDLPFETAEPEAFSGETRAFPRMSFEEMDRMASQPAEAPAPAADSQWGESQEAFGTGPSFPSTPDPFASTGSVESAPEQAMSQGWESPPAPSSEEPAWQEPQRPADPAWMSAEMPSGSFDTGPAPSVEPFPAPTEHEQPAFSTSGAAETESQRGEPAWAPEPAGVSAPAGTGGELSEAQVERIARRVVEMLSDQVVRNIAWEIIPDLAEMVVKERIRQLESEG